MGNVKCRMLMLQIQRRGDKVNNRSRSAMPPGPERAWKASVASNGCFAEAFQLSCCPGEHPIRRQEACSHMQTFDFFSTCSGGAERVPCPQGGCSSTTKKIVCFRLRSCWMDPSPGQKRPQHIVGQPIVPHMAG